MSTRSGKRIHNSFHEDIMKLDVENVAYSERKTRSKRLKENVPDTRAGSSKNKKRTNYVTYPSEEEVGSDAVDAEVDIAKPIRLLRKNALKELNLATPSLEKEEALLGTKIATRITRKMRKFAEEPAQDKQIHIEEENSQETEKPKNGKKKKLQEQSANISKSTTKKKKGKGKTSGSLIIEDVDPVKAKKMSLNKSNLSSDSFHSAAGSPITKDIFIDDKPMIVSPQKEPLLHLTNEKNILNTESNLEKRKTRSSTRHSNVNIALPSTPKQTSKESRKRKSSTKDLDLKNGNITSTQESPEVFEDTFNQSKKHKSSTKEDSFGVMITNTTFVKDINNTTFDLEDKEQGKPGKNSTFDKIDTTSVINTTNDKDDEIYNRNSIEDSTSDKKIFSDRKRTSFEQETILNGSAYKRKTRKSTINPTSESCLNDSQIEKDYIKKSIVVDTFEKDAEINQEPKIRRSSIKITRSSMNSLESDSETDEKKNVKPSRLSSPYQKDSTEFNSTYDKSDSKYYKDQKLDTTFEKNSITSVISSDNSNDNATSDRSGMSITSDDSSENIVNTTPVLIESSLDDSQITLKVSPPSLQPITAPITPLKREGTFTKDTEVESPKTKEPKTPTRSMSMPSPGSTPYPNKVNVKEKSIMNVTRSIEKSRRSSLAEPLPRATKVMFCSPVNNLAVVLQQKRKVVKSNLKGSNKSFVYEENAATIPRPVPRKRSYTQSDVDEARAKRSRFTDGQQHPVERLSRPRTSSASGKLAEPVTPSKKTAVKISRTKLPNFAALHQKEFDKMESLGEGQERRAKRAKQLLTPTGAITVLERRVSPKDTATDPGKSSSTEPQKEKKDKEEQSEKASKGPPKKPETPVKSLPSFKSLNPGYTRFGFKLNLDVNPFSIPKKSDVQNSTFNFSSKKDSKAKAALFTFSSKKDMKPQKDKNILKREATLPSLVGTTSVRREVAKQTIMREKSFTDKRVFNRNENRTVIKGVRTNRRFELQMKMRNLDQ